METGEVKEKEIEILGFDFNIKIKKLDDDKSYVSDERLYLSHLPAFKKVRKYHISICYLGDDRFYIYDIVWGCEIKGMYNEYIQKAEDFASFINENNDLDFFNDN